VETYQCGCEEEGGGGAFALSCGGRRPGERGSHVSILHGQRSADGRQRYVNGWTDRTRGEEAWFEERNERSSYETCRFHLDGA